eukprot:NODE_5_length_72347_cov_1.339331.p47 type:complete len:171 gc:universal NODE_5_length_72347_cov_1.339331:71794-71282(-)
MRSGHSAVCRINHLIVANQGDVMETMASNSISNTLLVSFASQAIFGTFLVTMGDILNGPLFILSGAFGLHAVSKKQRLVSAGLVYLFSILTFFTIILISVISEDQQLSKLKAPRDDIADARRFLIWTTSVVLICVVAFASTTLAYLKRFYITLDEDIPKLQISEKNNMIV